MSNSQNKVFLQSNIKLFVAFVLFIICIPSVAQEDAPKFAVKIKMQVESGSLENALITITKNGKTDRVIDPNKGKYSVDLDLGAEYALVFTKMGYITKTVMIDTHVPNGREKEEFAKFTATVELAKQPEDEVITYSQPVGRIKYSVPFGDFDFDKDYTATAEAMIKKAEANPTPKPKPPTPAPRIEPKPPPPPPPVAPSKPIPVEVKQPEYKPEPPKPKPVVKEPETPVKPIVKNKEEKLIQEDKKRITVITVNINGVDYVYKREEYNWGGTYFYKDGKYITERTFAKETE
jgi:hypothetical protein